MPGATQPRTRPATANVADTSGDLVFTRGPNGVTSKMIHLNAETPTRPFNGKSSPTFGGGALLTTGLSPSEPRVRSGLTRIPLNPSVSGTPNPPLKELGTAPSARVDNWLNGMRTVIVTWDFWSGKA